MNRKISTTIETSPDGRTVSATIVITDKKEEALNSSRHSTEDDEHLVIMCSQISRKHNILSLFKEANITGRIDLVSWPGGASAIQHAHTTSIMIGKDGLSRRLSKDYIRKVFGVFSSSFSEYIQQSSARNFTFIDHVDCAYFDTDGVGSSTGFSARDLCLWSASQILSSLAQPPHPEHVQFFLVKDDGSFDVIPARNDIQEWKAKLHGFPNKAQHIAVQDFQRKSTQTSETNSSISDQEQGTLIVLVPTYFGVLKRVLQIQRGNVDEFAKSLNPHAYTALKWVPSNVISLKDILAHRCGRLCANGAGCIEPGCVCDALSERCI